MTSPTSPAEAARAYQASLIAALGEDDPATAQSAAVGAWRSLVAAAGPDLRTRPKPEAWSVIECLGHAADAEIVMSARYRWVLSEDEPALAGYDQEAWPRALRHAEADPNDLLAVLEALRAANVRLWLATGPEGRRRIGRHLERGPESFDMMFRMLAGHDRVHQAQARRALEAVRA